MKWHDISGGRSSFAQRLIVARHRLPVVRRLRPAALFRAIQWALPKGHRAYPTRGGRLYVDVSEAPSMLARALGLYEPEKHRALRQVLRPGMTFVDVGACKGDFALFASRRVGPAGQVVAVEPEPGNATWVRKSVARSDIRNVHVEEAALSDSNGSSILHRADVAAGVEVSSGWHSLTTGVVAQSDDIAVQTLTLDDLLAGLDVKDVDVLKIDVEGWEAAVLRGAVQTLTQLGHQPIVMMDLHPHLGVDPEAISAVLRGHGYDIFRMESPNEPLEVRGDTLELIARPSRGASSA